VVAVCVLEKQSTEATMNTTSTERKFHVYKREANGYTHKIGTVLCANKVQADTRVRMMFGRGVDVSQGEAVWAVDPDKEDDLVAA
jgi:hypothetical protein